MKEKICKVCNLLKPVEDFMKCGWFRGDQRYRPECRNCYRNFDRFMYKNDRFKRYKERNPEKINAQKKAKESVRLGKILKPESCSKCNGIFPKYLIHGHHQDYSKPLEVIWLCPRCHKDAHRLMKLPHTAI